MHPRSFRRLLVAAGSVPLLTIAVTAPTFGTSTPEPDPGSFTATPLTPTEIVTGDKALSSQLARTPASLLERTDDTPINVMIKYDYDATASYSGGVDGLAPTSPRVTGRKLNGRSAAERAYVAHVVREERDISASVRRAVPDASIGASFRTVYGGVAARVPANEVKDIVNLPGVVAVQPDRMEKLLTDASSDFIHATAVQEALGGAPNAGEGLIYGNLDSGVWPEHESFQDKGNLGAPPGPARACNFGDNPLTPGTDVFQCNNKLIGGQPFLSAYLSSPSRAAAEPFHTARDSNGHGTHTASTSAGNVVATAPLLGIDRGPARGVAPGAWVMEYKVCGIQGCFASDSTAAVGQAILDGVDVINFSISGGSDPYSDPVELAFLDAYAANVFVSASAGNSGPGAGTAEHSGPWTTTVAASTQQREFSSTLTVRGDGGATFTAEGVSITDGVGPLPIVLASAPPYSNALCTKTPTAGMFTGKIVACQRGPGRVAKGYTVRQGGAAGMVLYNPSLAEALSDSHFLPTVHLPDGAAFLTFMGSHTGLTAEFTRGARTEGQGDVMAAFSSRGPSSVVIKPDITAPGVQILAGNTPMPDSVAGGPPGSYYQAIAGTSMSSPHIAGSALLVRAAHPTWTPGQIKSALMTSAVTDVVKENLTTPADPFDMGAGRVDVGAAVDVPLTLDESPERMAALGATELTAVHLNLPSVNVPVMPGELTTTRTVTNSTNVTQRYSVSAQIQPDSKITVSPARITLSPGQSQQLTITVSSKAPKGAQRFGTINLVPRKGIEGALHLPVAFIRTQGKVALTQQCTPDSVRINGSSTCEIVATSTGFDDQPIDLTTTTNTFLRITGATGATVTDTRVAQVSATLAGARPGVPSAAAGASPGGFLPLSSFGAPATAVGDEQLVTFNVPAYLFNGRTYTSLSVTSNGTIIAGAATQADLNCCSLPTGPDPAPPNNVMAPFWTDLDGTGAPGIRASVLTNGTNSWIVIESQLNTFGTTQLQKSQVWIGIDGTQDVSYAYDPAALPANPAGQPFLVGAENELGQGDMRSFLPTTDQVVRSTAATPAGTLQYTVTVIGNRSGSGAVTTRMQGQNLPGVTVVDSGVEVTR